MYSVLIVDDDPDICDSLRFILEDRGFHVQTASGGDIAFELFIANKIDIVLTDFNMQNGNGNGFELLKRIKQISPSTPVGLFVTDADEVVAKVVKAGADFVFSKPTPNCDLLDAIFKILEAIKK